MWRVSIRIACRDCEGACCVTRRRLNVVVPKVLVKAFEIVVQLCVPKSIPLTSVSLICLVLLPNCDNLANLSDLCPFSITIEPLYLLHS